MRNIPINRLKEAQTDKRSGSVVECKTWDPGIASSRLTWGTVMCTGARHYYILCLVLIQPRKTGNVPPWLKNCWLRHKASTQTKKRSLNCYLPLLSASREDINSLDESLYLYFWPGSSPFPWVISRWLGSCCLHLLLFFCFQLIIQIFHLQDMFHVYLNKFEVHFLRLHIIKTNKFYFSMHKRRVPGIAK